MADNAPNTTAECAATFDPDAWLSRFESIGGGYVLADHLELLVPAPGLAGSQGDDARRMISTLSEQDRTDLLHHIRSMRARTDDIGRNVIDAESAGGNLFGRDKMNMMTSIEIETALPFTAAHGSRFYSGSGTSTIDLEGPDVMLARPIAEVIEHLDDCGDEYAFEFLGACREAGIHITAVRGKDGEERLNASYPVDDQVILRCERSKALTANLRRHEARRHHVIRLMKECGWYHLA